MGRPTSSIAREDELEALRIAFHIAVGKRFAIPLDDLFPILESVLKQGRMTRMNAAAFICINSNEHETSRFSRLKFLKQFMKLYTATTWQECAEIEGIKEDLDIYSDYNIIKDMGGGDDKEQDPAKLENVKAFCWLRDVNHATRPKLWETVYNLTQHVSSMSIQSVLSCYNEKAAASLDLADKQEKRRAKLENREEKKDLMALPKGDFLPLLRTAKKVGTLSETQSAMMLMFILHSREKRHDGTSYIIHPVSVAKLVAEHGGQFLGNDEKLIWMATLVAMLHDAWEENNIESIREDLEGLVPEGVIDAVAALHKKEGENYFDYLKRVANNPLAAVVKLCDLKNNSEDMDLENNIGSSKQAIVYNIASNYMKFRLENPDLEMSVENYVEDYTGLTAEEFERINIIAESKDKIILGQDEESNPIIVADIKAAKKRPASDFSSLQAALIRVKLPSAKDVFKEVDSFNAHSRGKENPPLHPRPDV